MEYDRPKQLDISPMTIALAKAIAEQEKEELQQLNHLNPYYIDSDELILEDRPENLIAEESIMSKKNLFYLRK
jgi:hypothetical protein